MASEYKPLGILPDWKPLNFGRTPAPTKEEMEALLTSGEFDKMCEQSQAKNQLTARQFMDKLISGEIHATFKNNHMPTIEELEDAVRKEEAGQNNG